ncbi:MAG: hypothetical protein KAH32_02510 [Chlamydiia bacterium]|nr:hypothetical protein [Chlamydiia bacterium]
MKYSKNYFMIDAVIALSIFIFVGAFAFININKLFHKKASEIIDQQISLCIKSASKKLEIDVLTMQLHANPEFTRTYSDSINSYGQYLPISIIMSCKRNTTDLPGELELLDETAYDLWIYFDIHITVLGCNRKIQDNTLGMIISKPN